MQQIGSFTDKHDALRAYKSLSERRRNDRLKADNVISINYEKTTSTDNAETLQGCRVITKNRGRASATCMCIKP